MTEEGPRYAVHPGWVRSVSDGQDHYIGVDQLVQLYGLRTGEYVVWDERALSGFARGDRLRYVHLHPRLHREDYDRERTRIENRRRSIAGMAARP